MEDESSEPKGQRFWCVENFSMADVLTEAERDELHERMQFDSYKQGETIYFPGDPDDTVYSVHYGRVRLVYLDASGRRLTLAIIGPGQVFGETALIGSAESRWIAEALEDSVVCRILRVDLLRFAEQNPKLALRITKMVGKRMVEIENKLESLIFKGVPSRLARTLVQLAEDYGDPGEGGTRIGIRLTHQELGNLIGATRETTSSTLAEFESNGWIRKSGRDLILSDLQGLKRVAGEP